LALSVKKQRKDRAFSYQMQILDVKNGLFG
jgi:hypothetical protein